MKRWFFGVACLCISCGLWSCGAENTGNSGAETPRPGPAATEEDIGPPPAGQTEPPLDAPAAEGETGANIEGARAMEDVSLTLSTWDEAQKVVAASAGRVVVLDLWSTSCVPCRREFPQLVRLHRERGSDVACISYSLDFSGRASRPPESYRDVVLKFLVEQGATFPNFLSTDDPDALHERLELAAIPAVYVYDRQGELRKRFDNEDPGQGEFTYEADVIPFVEQLLAEQ